MPLDDGYPRGWEAELIKTTLERIHFAARTAINDELAAALGTAELQAYRDEMCARMVYAINAEVLAERLEPDVQRVSFTREVDVTVHDQHHWRLVHPRTRWDAVKTYLLPGWLRRRLKPARLKAATAWTQPKAHIAEQMVTVDEDVTIERFFTFPNSTLAYPKDLGAPVYYERRAR